MASSARLGPGSQALILALVSGILLALSFPRYGHPLLAWLALTPLIIALCGVRDDWPAFRRDRTFLLGFVTGIGYFGGTVYWTGTVVTQFGGLSWPVGVVVAALLVGYLALFPGLFALCLGWLGARLGRRALLLAPAIWVSTELARTYFWSGFPWLLLGYSQTTVLPVAQIASIVGVFGVSALVATVSTAIAYLVLSPLARRDRRSPGAWLATVLGIALWGNHRLRNDALVDQGRPVRVALIQGNIPQDQKWDDAQAPSHPQHVSFDDARCGAPGRAARHLARVVDPVSVPGRSGRRRADSCVGTGNRHRVAARQRSSRSRHQVVLQRRVSREERRRRGRRVSEDAPRAVWRVRPAAAAVVLRGAVGRSGGRFYAGSRAW